MCTLHYKPKSVLLIIVTIPRIFGYLMLRNRILTQDIMRKRHILCQLGCVMCCTREEETAMHLLFKCRWVRQVWQEISNRLRYRALTLRDTMEQTWFRSLSLVGRPVIWKRIGPIVLMCTVWMLWRIKLE